MAGIAHLDCILLRHGETADVAAGLISGQRDVVLTVRGRQQVAAVAERVAQCGPQSIVCSDLARTRETAVLIAEQLRLPEPLVDARLRERHWGIYQGKPRGSAPPLRDTEAPPGGESLVALRQRVFEALAQVSSRTLVVTHAGPMRMVLQLLGRAMEGPAPCGLVDLTIPRMNLNHAGACPQRDHRSSVWFC